MPLLCSSKPLRVSFWSEIPSSHTAKRKEALNPICSE